MRLPSYRTSLLRFHPYPRVKLSQREIMQTVDDRLSGQYDVIEDDDGVGLVILDFPDLPEEQHLNAVNLQEVLKAAETGAQPHVRRLSFTTLIIDLAILVARKLSLKPSSSP